MSSKNQCIFIGCIFGFLSVAIGAFGAHALEPHLNEQMAQVFKTATHYQMFHALALILYGVASAKSKMIFGLFTVGVFLFSGSLYLLAVTNFSALGMLTPLGGICFLLGWFFWAKETVKGKQIV